MRPSEAGPQRLREAGLNLSALEAAFDEFFAEGYAYQTNRAELEEADDAETAELLRKVLPPRLQAEGYFAWLRYLCWLDGACSFTPLQLTRTEVEGLSILRRARNRFQRTHPPCPACGMPNDEHEYCCYHCLKELKN